MEAKGIYKIPGALAATFFALTGCAAPGQVGPDPGFRSALLRDVGGGESSVERGRERSGGASFSLPAPTRKLDSQCTVGFRHPVLNRCDFFEPRPTPVREGVRCSEPGACRQSLVDQARALRGRGSYRVGGQDFPRDCAGFTLAALTGAGLDLASLLPAGGREGGGVGLLHGMASQRGMLHRGRVPQIGDLVFFDNTWDRNRNGRADDPLTHVGIVERVDADGTITFLHRVARGELRYRMNLFRPDERRDPKTGKVLNHYLRVGGGDQRLTGQLFRAFATVFR